MISAPKDSGVQIPYAPEKKKKLKVSSKPEAPMVEPKRKISIPSQDIPTQASTGAELQPEEKQHELYGTPSAPPTDDEETKSELRQLLQARQGQTDKNIMWAGASATLGELLFGGGYGDSPIADTGTALIGQQMKRRQGLEDQEHKVMMAESAAKAKAKAKAKDDAKKMKEGRFKDAMSMRRFWSGLPTTKDTQAVTAGYSKIRKAINSVPSAAGDISLIFGYMKMLDPRSTVREGEQATAAQARGLPEGIVTMYHRVLSGEKLGDEQRADFANRAKEIYATQRDLQGRVDAQTQSMAEKSGIEDKITMDFGSSELLGEFKPKARQKRGQGWLWEWNKGEQTYKAIRKLKDGK